MTQQQAQGLANAEQQPVKPARNPCVLNFCRVLVEKKGEANDPESGSS